MANNRPIFEDFKFKTSKEAQFEKPAVKRDLSDRVLTSASEALEFTNNAFWIVASVTLFTAPKLLLLAGAAVKTVGSNTLPVLFGGKGSDKKFVPVSTGIGWAADQLSGELQEGNKYFSENYVTIKAFHQGDEIPKFKEGVEGRVYSIPEKIVQKSIDNKLENHEQVLGVVAAQRSEDLRFFKTYHRFLNWQDCLNVISNVSYQNHEKHGNKVKGLQSSTITKAVKELFFTTEAFFNRDINDAYDFMPLIFNSRKSFTGYNFARGGKFVLGSMLGSNNRGEIATALVYGDAVKDATPSYKADSLWHVWSSEKCRDALDYVLIKLDEQVKLYDQYKNAPGGIASCNVKSKIASHVSGYDAKTGEPIIEHFTYGELYKKSGGFSQETAIKVVQAEVQKEMEQNSQMRGFRGGNDSYLFEILLQPMTNYINDVNKTNKEFSGKKTNFTGQRFFDSDIPTGDLPKTQRVWSPQEQSYVLALMGEMVHGYVPQGVDNFVDANKHLVSTDPQRVDANQILLEKNISTKLIYALAAGLRPENSVVNSNDLDPGLAKAHLLGEALISQAVAEKGGNLNNGGVVRNINNSSEKTNNNKLLTKIGRFVIGAIIVAAGYFGYTKFKSHKNIKQDTIETPITPNKTDSLLNKEDTIKSTSRVENFDRENKKLGEPSTYILQQSYATALTTGISNQHGI